ncbi:MAG: hypothetical protein HMLKMBBP_02120 [Planctomycetes bacterium]|nr:hypothetical protein [Planctomycetota bacterium]
MAFEGKAIEELGAADLRALVAAAAAECRTVEYKRDAPGRNDEAKRELLKDVSSLANAAGGHLIYGIAAREGVPEDVCGFEEGSPDDLKLRVENSIRDGIRPRVHGVQSAVIGVGEGRVALVLRVPRSFCAPHMVTLGGWSRFFGRGSAGCFQLDVDDLRRAFADGAGASDRVRAFRAERISRILGGEAPSALEPGAVVVLHVVPFGERVGLPFPIGRAASIDREVLPLSSDAVERRWNFDGFLITSRGPGAYLQVLRSGAFESATDRLCLDGNILLTEIEDQVLARSGEYLGALRKLSAEGPAVILLSVLRCRGLQIPGTSFERHRRADHPIDRDHLLCPDVLVTDYGADLRRVLRPAFDSLWNAVGIRESASYASGGRWHTLRD